jgi:hypothetical protein
MPKEFPMLPHLLEKRAGAPRDRFLWAVLVALALGQLVAIGMLCAHQVRKAQMRDVSLEVQRVAVADCLQYVPRATLNSCADRVDPNRRDGSAVMPGGKQSAAPEAQRASMSSAASAGISYR